MHKSEMEDCEPQEEHLDMMSEEDSSESEKDMESDTELESNEQDDHHC